MEKFSNIGALRSFATTVALATTLASCSTPTAEQFELDFNQRAHFRAETPLGTTTLRVATETCEPYRWHGATSHAAAFERPLLGLFADGRKSTATDENHLTPDDLGRDIDGRMATMRRSDWIADSSLSTTPNWVNGHWRTHSSRRYGGPPNSEVPFVKGPDLLHQIVSTLGAPSVASVPDCGSTIVLQYNIESRPRAVRKTGGPSGLPRPKCEYGGSFLRIEITAGLYSVSNPESCEI